MTDTRPAAPLCLGRCGYALTSPLAQARGYGHRCWAKLPAELRAAVTTAVADAREQATVRLLRRQRDTVTTPPQTRAKASIPRRLRTTAATNPDQLQLTDQDEQ